MAKKLIPFSWLPASWGLSGQALDEAKAYYELEGYDLEVRLAEIQLSGDAYKTRLAEISRNWGLMTDYEYQVEIASLITDDTQRKIAMLEIDIQKGTVNPNTGNKEVATLKGEPWIHVLKVGMDEDTGGPAYYFEFDWNDIWITRLKEAGYMGPTEESIVQSWFQELCRQEASLSMGAPPINGGISYS